MILEKKITEHKTCFDLLSNIHLKYLSKKNSETYHKCKWVLKQCACYSSRFWMELKFSRYSFKNSQVSNFIKFHPVGAMLHLDRHNKPNSHFSKFCNITKKWIRILQFQIHTINNKTRQTLIMEQKQELNHWRLIAWNLSYTSDIHLTNTSHSTGDWRSNNIHVNCHTSPVTETTYICSWLAHNAYAPFTTTTLPTIYSNNNKNNSSECWLFAWWAH